METTNPKGKTWEETSSMELCQGFLEQLPEEQRDLLLAPYISKYSKSNTLSSNVSPTTSNVAASAPASAPATAIAPALAPPISANQQGAGLKAVQVGD